MAKIEIDIVKKFLFEMECLIDGIPEIIKMGEDNLKDCINDTCEDITNHIKTFKAINLTIPEKEVKNKRKKYLDIHDECIEKVANELTDYENKCIRKTQLYLYVKKQIRDTIKAEDMASWNSESLPILIESHTIDYENYYGQIVVNHFFDAVEVFEDIANEIREHRKLNPQQKMF